MTKLWYSFYSILRTSIGKGWKINPPLKSKVLLKLSYSCNWWWKEISITWVFFSVILIILVIVSLEVIVEKDILSISYQLLTVRLDCQARHPKRCKHEENCKFFKQGICAHGEKLNSLEKENKRLKEENIIIKHKID